MPNFTMCLGPNCGSGQIHGGGNDQPIMTCTTCRFKTCFTHKMPWHKGLTCNQYDAKQAKRVRQEAASAEVLSKTTKVCPNPKCGLHLDKYAGCDHVRCKYHYHVQVNSYILTLKQVRIAVMNSVGYVSRHLPRSEIEGIPSTLLTANTIPTARMVS